VNDEKETEQIDESWLFLKEEQEPITSVPKAK
jgi:hypothetical protein